MHPHNFDDHKYDNKYECQLAFITNKTRLCSFRIKTCLMIAKLNIQNLCLTKVI